MFGIPVDTLFAWSTAVSLGALAIATLGTVVSYHLSAQVATAHLRELQQTRIEAHSEIEASRAIAAEAAARVAQFVRSRAEFQQKLQIEKHEPPEFLRASTKPLDSDIKATVPAELLGSAEDIDLIGDRLGRDRLVKAGLGK
jgi:hypothetical protein